MLRHMSYFSKVDLHTQFYLKRLTQAGKVKDMKINGLVIVGTGNAYL